MNGRHAGDLVDSGALPPATRVLRVAGAGHQLILDDPNGFASALNSIRTGAAAAAAAVPTRI